MVTCSFRYINPQIYCKKLYKLAMAPRVPYVEKYSEAKSYCCNLLMFVTEIRMIVIIKQISHESPMTCREF